MKKIIIFLLAITYQAHTVEVIISTDTSATLMINSQSFGHIPRKEKKIFNLPPGKYHVVAVKQTTINGYVGEYRAEKMFSVETNDAPRQSISLALTYDLLPEEKKRRTTNAEKQLDLSERDKKMLDIALMHRTNNSRKNDFEVNQNGTVIDKRTALQWMRCSIGQKWTGATCSGKPRKMTWGSANMLSQTVSYAEKNDWRLPTLYELKTLVYCSSGKNKQKNDYEVSGSFIYPPFLYKCDGQFHTPTIFSNVFPNTSDTSYWSSTAIERIKIGAWGVNFFTGGDSSVNKSYKRAVRFVRNNK